MICRLFVAAAIAFLTAGTFLGSQPLAIAATRAYTPSKQDYPSQSEYDKKQSNQADGNKKQYAQQEQPDQKE